MRAMTLLFVATVLTSLVVAMPPKHHQLDGYTFDQYVVDQHKQHAKGTAEWDRRAALFAAELAEVQKHNGDKMQTYKKGINKFSDWSADEKKALRGNRVAMKGQPGVPKPEKGFGATGAKLPRFVDYRTASPPVLTAVKNQGDCGSCWAHAATETIESHNALATGELFVLSQQEITSCTVPKDDCGGTGGCMGSIVENAFGLAKQIGMIEEWVFPYTSFFGTTQKCPAETFIKKYNVVNISGFTKVTHNDAVAVKEALALVGPLAISVDASHWSNYESGIFTGCSYAKNISMDHAVQAVGYGHDFDLGLDYWLVRNSWSAGWGELGFIKLLRQPDGVPEKCGWNVHPENGDGCKGQKAPEWACGMCGIAYDTVYTNPAV